LWQQQGGCGCGFCGCLFFATPMEQRQGQRQPVPFLYGGEQASPTLWQQTKAS
jgi:hypothetical protein